MLLAILSHSISNPPSSSNPVIVLDSPVKPKYKTTFQKIKEYEERNKDRIATLKKYRDIEKIKLPATKAVLPNNGSLLKDLVMELGVQVGHNKKKSRGETEQIQLKD